MLKHPLGLRKILKLIGKLPPPPQTKAEIATINNAVYPNPPLFDVTQEDPQQVFKAA